MDDETVDGADCADHQRLDVPEQLVHGLSPVPHCHVKLEILEPPSTRAERKVGLQQYVRNNMRQNLGSPAQKKCALRGNGVGDVIGEADELKATAVHECSKPDVYFN